jgi:hypothetical protein
MKKLHIIAVQPIDLVYWWTLRVWLTNLRKYDLSQYARVLIWIPFDRIRFQKHPRWGELEKDFPEAKFFYYADVENNLANFIQPYNYIPLLRPICLEKHFAQYPELSKDAIYYTDCDTVFTKDPVWLRGDWIQDDIDRMSFTGVKANNYNYQGAKYLDEKVKDVEPETLEAYKKVDVVDGLAKIFQLDRAFFESKEDNFGGVQYLLKNLDATYWRDIKNGCLHIRQYFDGAVGINRRFFTSKSRTAKQNEDKGIQSWCADLWANQLNLWRLGRDTQTPDEMNFIWATDPIEKWDSAYIYHDAGASSSSIKAIDGGEGFLFNKRAIKYIHNQTTPFEEDLSYVCKDYCSYKYVECIEEANPEVILID